MSAGIRSHHVYELLWAILIIMRWVKWFLWGYTQADMYPQDQFDTDLPEEHCIIPDFPTSAPLLWQIS